MGIFLGFPGVHRGQACTHRTICASPLAYMSCLPRSACLPYFWTNLHSQKCVLNKHFFYLFLFCMPAQHSFKTELRWSQMCLCWHKKWLPTCSVHTVGMNSSLVHQKLSYRFTLSKVSGIPQLGYVSFLVGRQVLSVNFTNIGHATALCLLTGPTTFSWRPPKIMERFLTGLGRNVIMSGSTRWRYSG